jgi:hypothetical protein
MKHKHGNRAILALEGFCVPTLRPYIFAICSAQPLEDTQSLPGLSEQFRAFCSVDSCLDYAASKTGISALK